MGKAVEAVIESDLGYEPAANRGGDEGTRAFLQPATLDVLRHRFGLGREQVVEIAGGDPARLCNRRRIQSGLAQMRFDVADDPQAVRRDER
jgi:hypothetical protein